MAGGGVRGRGVCFGGVLTKGGGRAWHTVNERAVRILLECILVYVNTFKLFFHCSEKPVQRHLKNVYSCLSICMLAAAAGGYVHLFTNLMQASAQLFISFTCTFCLHLDIKDEGKIFAAGKYIIISYCRPACWLSLVLLDYWFCLEWHLTTQPIKQSVCAISQDLLSSLELVSGHSWI